MVGGVRLGKFFKAGCESLRGASPEKTNKICTGML
jgi:hypothetical protein